MTELRRPLQPLGPDHVAQERRPLGELAHAEQPFLEPERLRDEDVRRDEPRVVERGHGARQHADVCRTPRDDLLDRLAQVVPLGRREERDDVGLASEQRLDEQAW